MDIARLERYNVKGPKALWLPDHRVVSVGTTLSVTSSQFTSLATGVFQENKLDNKT